MIRGRRQLATVVAGAAAVLLMPILGEFTATGKYSLTNPSIDLGLSSPAWAIPQTSSFQYSPPDRGTPRTTQGAGSRGCTQSGPVTLALLVPNDHIGQTTAGHPTFFWHVSDTTAVPVEFSLVEPGVPKPIFVKQMQVTKGEIVQVQLPKELPELVPGRKYRWSVSIICNANRPSTNVFVQSWIERVPVKPELQEQLAAATSERDRAQTYAAAGLWYDSLAAISTAYNTNPNERSVMEARLSLLEQVGLTNVAAKERQRLALQ